MANLALDIIACVLGVLIVVGTMYDAAMTTTHPGPGNSWLATQTFRGVFLMFRLPLAVARTQGARRRLLNTFGPLALVCVPFAWFLSALFGFALLFWSLGVGTPFESLIDSGSALSTLGFKTPPLGIEELIAIAEGAIGVGLIGFWITFLPGIVAVGTQRDELVSQFSLVAGTPPSALRALESYYSAQQSDRLTDKWTEWTNWFVFLRDTHPPMPVISLVRSGQAELSWVATAGAILDGAALSLTAIDQVPDMETTLCMRAGIAALTDIEAALQRVFHWFPPSQAGHSAPEPTRAEFDAACERLARAGVPLKADREQALRDFCAWRVQYIPWLHALGRAVAAPLGSGLQ